MPTAQVLHAIAEHVINPLLKLDDKSIERLNALKSKRLVIYLQELSWPVELAFEGELSIHQFSLDWGSANARDAENECRIKTSLATLNELKDSRQITRLIREHKLDLEGDIHIAQKVSALFQELDIDWEEVLARKVGDVAAYQLMKSAKRAKLQAQNQLFMFNDALAALLLDEKKLAAHRLQVVHFSDQVNDVRDATERLTARIQQLEDQ